MLRNKGYKSKLKNAIGGIIKKYVKPGIIYNAPRKAIGIATWRELTNRNAEIIKISESQKRKEELPEIYNYPISGRFRKYETRVIPESTVTRIDGASVYGIYTNIVLLDPHYVALDFSRQFGAYGGATISESKLIKYSLWLPRPKFLKGRIAVITTEGADNFHHWMYDSMPRIFLLMKSGIFDTIDFFLISHKGQPFQKELLHKLGVADEKIINPQKENAVLYAAETLFIPSLPSELGTVSPWVVSFLDGLFNKDRVASPLKRVFLSRKNVGTRHISNDTEVRLLFKAFGITEVFPEDYSVTEFSSIIAGATFIISVHGSGLSNICFASPGTVIVDLLAPYHQDCYYWLISNLRQSRYIGFFSEGQHPDDNFDLVKNKIDNDLYINVEQLKSLLDRELNRDK